MPKQSRYTTTFRFGADHTLWLTRTSFEIRSRTGAALNRSALLRGILDGVSTSRLDLSACVNEKEIRAAVARAIGGSSAAAKGRA